MNLSATTYRAVQATAPGTLALTELPIPDPHAGAVRVRVEACGDCGPCRHGNLVACENQAMTGVHGDGGWAEVLIAQAAGLISIPDELDAVEAAPLLRAGLTTFAALRKSGARPGDTVAVLGLGGLGHLGVQYARRMGFRVVAIARGPEKAALAERLGARTTTSTARPRTPRPS
jgi:D-arabinose 1-dehydrogenase-like Zn-dependent alcohol dehydrogenase